MKVRVTTDLLNEISVGYETLETASVIVDVPDNLRAHVALLWGVMEARGPLAKQLDMTTGEELSTMLGQLDSTFGRLFRALPRDDRGGK